MKNLPKILKIIFICIFTFQLVALAILFMLPNITSAADVRFSPQVEFPGFDKEAANYGMDKTGQGYLINGNSIGILIRVVYKYLIGTVGILATIVMMVGGFLWLSSAGNSSRIGEAKKLIGASITGLILALTSYMILATVNPALTEFKSLDIKSIATVSSKCCVIQSLGNDGISYECKPMSTEEDMAGCAQGQTRNQTCSTLAECKDNIKTGKFCYLIDNFGKDKCEESQTGTCPNQSFVSLEECVKAADATCQSGEEKQPCNNLRGYCENLTCKSCIQKGSICQHNADNYECANSDGRCGFGIAADCNGNALGLCEPNCICEE